MRTVECKERSGPSAAIGRTGKIRGGSKGATMKGSRMLRAFTLAAALGMPGLATAQQAGGQSGGQAQAGSSGSQMGSCCQGQEGQMGQMSQTQFPAGPEFGVLHGTVAKVNLAKGTVTVRSGNDALVLNGNPTQLA